MPAHKIKLGDAGPTLSFRNDAELFEGARAELLAWEWLNRVAIDDWRDGNGRHYTNNLRHHSRERLTVLDNAVHSLSSERVVNALSELYQKGGIPHPRSSDGRLVQELARLSPMYGLGGLYACVGTERPPAQIGVEPGVIMFWSKRAKALDFSADAEAVKAASLDAARIVDAAHQQLVNGRSRQRSATLRYLGLIRKKRNQLHSSVMRQHDDAIISIKGVENSYLKQMALQAPVAYWKGRADKHADQFRNMSIVSGVYALISVLFLGVGGFVFLRAEVSAIVAKGAPAQLVFVELSLFLMVATIIFWVGRVLSKIMLSERHFATDAAERAVMAETFLALQQDGSVSDAERPLVLNALFRATTDGVVKDDGGGDASVAALLARALTPGSGR